MSEKTTIQIDKELKNILEGMGSKNESYNMIIERLIEKNKLASVDNLKTATVDKYGNVYIGKPLVGKTIEYKVKQ